MRRPLLALLGLLALGACQSSASGADDGGRVQVVSTMSVFSDFARAVGGDLIEVETLVEIGGDPHTYEPAPGDAAAISDADVVLDNGLGLSPWFEPLAVNAGDRLVVLTEDIAEEAVQTTGKIDPHMWMVPDYVAQGYIPAIEAALSAADPEHADTYAANADAYRRTLDDLDAELSEQMATIPPANRQLVTSHDAYSYFAAQYGLEVTGSVVGVTTEEQPSAQTVGRLVDLIRAENVPTIFVETTVNPEVVERIARDAEVGVGDALYGDSVGPAGSGAEDYVGMMRANVRAIVDGLGGRTS